MRSVFFYKPLKFYGWNTIPRKSKDQTLPIGSRESFTWIILKTILCLVLDFQGIYNEGLIEMIFLSKGGDFQVPAVHLLRLVGRTHFHVCFFLNP